MHGDASTLPLRDGAVGGRLGGRPGRLARLRGAVLAGADGRRLAGTLALAAIVVLSALIVVMAADRPSILSATTHANFLPRWMAGPLGGLWPGLTRSATTLRYLFTGAVALMYVSYLLVVAYAPRLRTWTVLGAIAAVHVLFLLAPPLSLTDVFNYVNYARMEVVHHLNPYTTIPILEPHTDPSFTLSNWHQLLSPYGPLFTLLTFLVVPLGVAGSFWALKGVLMLASLGTLAIVWRCARLLDRDPLAAVALVGLNPIVLVWGLGGDHNDFLMLLCIVLGIYLLLLGRERLGVERRAGVEARAGVEQRADVERASPSARASLALHAGAGAVLVAAAAIKASAAVLLPIALVSLLRRRNAAVALALGMLVAGVALGIASLLAFGLHIPDLNTQSRLVTNESVPNLVGLAIGTGGENEAIRAVMSSLLAIALLLSCWLAWRRQDAITAAGWASVALLVTLSWVLPWYVLWALPLAALSRSRRLRATVLVLGVYLLIAWAPASGLLWNQIGFHPERTPLGRLHQRYVKELLN